MDNNHDLLQNDLVLDSTGQGYLKETGKWAAFLGILGFISSAILVIASFFIGAFLDKIITALAATSANPSAASIFGALGGVLAGIYFFLGVLSFFLALFLYRFGSKIKQAFLTHDQEILNLSFKNLKNYYRVVGILTIVYLSIVALALIIVIIAAASTHH